MPVLAVPVVHASSTNDINDFYTQHFEVKIL